MPYKFFENSYWIKGIFEEAHRQGIGVLLNGDRGNLLYLGVQHLTIMLSFKKIKVDSAFSRIKSI